MIFHKLLLLLFIAVIQCQEPLLPTTKDANPAINPFAALAVIIGTVTNIAQLLGKVLEPFNGHQQNDVDLVVAPKIHRYDTKSDVYQEAVLYAKLCAASNCKASYDKWDCGENCKSTIPDGEVIRSFSTYPLNVRGYILRSEKEKKLFVMLRSDSSIRNKIVGLQRQLTPHPRIPGANVQLGLLTSMIDIRDVVYRTIRDQLKLHPEYQVRVAGHSYGAGVGSLLTVDLAQRLPQLNYTNLVGYLLGKPRIGDKAYATYIAEKNITIRRYVQGADDLTHLPRIADGYAHEGNEYWLDKSTQQLVVCPGPYETRNCSSSLGYGETKDHYTYFGIPQSCKDNIYNLY